MKSIALKDGEFVVSGYIHNEVHYAMTNFGVLWHRDYVKGWLTVYS